MWYEFDVFKRSGHETAQVKHTFHLHAANRAVSTHRGASLAQLLCKSTSDYEDAACTTVADMVKVDTGTSAAHLRLRHDVVDWPDGHKLRGEAYPGKEIQGTVP